MPTGRPLVATYRLQLTPELGFAAAAATLPYLARLGVSHVYLSPCFEATPGSRHGYDVTDPTALRHELGGAEGFEKLAAAAEGAGLGLVLDIVPHHMATGRTNRWWWDVLESGADSRYAGFFDIDWDPPERRLRGSIVLPVLGDHYGRELERGNLQLVALDGGRFEVHYYEHAAPLTSASSADLLERAADRAGCGELGFAARALGHAAAEPDPNQRDADVNGARNLIRRLLARRAELREAVQAEVDELNADPDRLDPLLDAQPHRFTRWQVAVHEIDYRRFFDINSLVALRAEKPPVFAATHDLVARLARAGVVDGLRIDHLDGLRDPARYLAWLREAVGGSTWLLVEKILGPGEQLPASWPVDGTTGYEFAAAVTGLLLDPAGLDELTWSWARFTGGDPSYPATRLQARREVLREGLGADLERVLSLLVRVCERHRRWRDFTRSELRTALFEVAIHAPGYRSYVRPTGDDEAGAGADHAYVESAVQAAKEEPTIDPDLLDFIRDLLLGRMPGDVERELLARFQQLTPPLAAKGEEDTAAYRWTRCLAANEVGSDPDRAAVSPTELYELLAARADRQPRGMLAATTHDTKRSQDVRARVALLTEIPRRWGEAVERWSAVNQRHRTVSPTGLPSPDGAAEWLLYQVLVGSHPLDAERAWPVVEKSLREAKLRTSWLRPDPDYERGVRAFLQAILADPGFVADLDRFVAPLVEGGYVNALSVLALQLMAPGVPDVYQGSELWDDRMVDPDNRRPVDFDRFASLLGDAGDRGPTAAELWGDPQARVAGLPKLALLRCGLATRRDHPEALGAGGTFRPVPVEGDASRVVGFLRGERVLVVVPRFVLAADPLPALRPRLVVPAGRWHNPLTGSTLQADGGSVPWNELRGDFPVAILARGS